MSKYNFNTKETFYQKARFFRKSDTNEFVYCIEPFEFFHENESYDETTNPYNLTQERINRVSQIAYYGYGYQDHTDPKWYAITQMMIWQASDDKGNYFFTKTLNGNPTNQYSAEITEINHLIEEHSKEPSFSNQEYEIVEGSSLSLQDLNQVLQYYQIQDDHFIIQGNQLTIQNLEEGEYQVAMTKKEQQRSTPVLFYQSYSSQNLVKTGTVSSRDSELKVRVVKTSLELNKIDKDTQDTTPSGDASLDGAIYEIQNENHEKIEELIIEDNKAIIENLDFGKYYIQEIEPGEGYTLDPTIYEIEITSDNPNVSLKLANEVIKKEILIEKTYGEEESWKKEQNIAFWIQDQNQNIIQTVSTNEEGEIKVTIPYGKYTIIQVNSTEGYEKVDPFEIQIQDSENMTIKLKDYKIQVPDTHTAKRKIPYRIILQILWILLS